MPFNCLLRLIFSTFLISISSALDGNYFETIEKMFINEEGRQATNVLQEDLAGGFDSPKEISITYNTVGFHSVEGFHSILLYHS